MRFLLITAIALLPACFGNSDDAKKLELSPMNGMIDLQKEIGGTWERVCIFGPYSDNSAATNALGFDWNLESNSSVSTNDGISLLVFVESDRVLSFYEVPRNNADFAELSGECFSRSDSTFRIHPRQSGWPEVRKA